MEIPPSRMQTDSYFSRWFLSNPQSNIYLRLSFFGLDRIIPQDFERSPECILLKKLHCTLSYSTEMEEDNQSQKTDYRCQRIFNRSMGTVMEILGQAGLTVSGIDGVLITVKACPLDLDLRANSRVGHGIHRPD